MWVHCKCLTLCLQLRCQFQNSWLGPSHLPFSHQKADLFRIKLSTSSPFCFYNAKSLTQLYFYYSEGPCFWTLIDVQVLTLPSSVLPTGASISTAHLATLLQQLWPSIIYTVNLVGQQFLPFRGKDLESLLTDFTCSSLPALSPGHVADSLIQ